MPKTIFNTACSPHNSINNAIPKNTCLEFIRGDENKSWKKPAPRLEVLAYLGLTFGATKTVKRIQKTTQMPEHNDSQAGLVYLYSAVHSVRTIKQGGRELLYHKIWMSDPNMAPVQSN